jgi:SAM-dependent methyltransferase
MNADREVSRHYSRVNLLSRLNAAMVEDGVDPDHPTIEQLAPYDQFHGRGLDATMEVAALMHAAASDHILDIGSGIGGPARYFANRFCCRVSGIDLTPEFCSAARHLTRLLQLDDRVTFEVADAVAMPFRDGAFDGAYSMNVSMNIRDKREFYHEIHRVLKAGAWLVLSEIAKGEGGDSGLSNTLGEQRPHELPVDPRGGADRLARSGVRHHPVAQYSRGSTRVRRTLPRDGRARREATASRRRAGPRRNREPGHGEHLTRPIGGMDCPHRDSGSEAALAAGAAGSVDSGATRAVPESLDPAARGVNQAVRRALRFALWSLMIVAALGGALAALFGYLVYSPAPEVPGCLARSPRGQLRWPDGNGLT